jgi:hypothetical protein
VLADAAPPECAGDSWATSIRRRAHATFHALSAYPGLSTFVLERPLGRQFRDGHRRDIEMLRAEGLSERDAQLVQASFHTYMFGLLGLEARFRPLKRGGRRGGEHDAILVDVDIDEFIDFGIDLVIEGLRSRARS